MSIIIIIIIILILIIIIILILILLIANLAGAAMEVWASSDQCCYGCSAASESACS